MVMQACAYLLKGRKSSNNLRQRIMQLAGMVCWFGSVMSACEEAQRRGEEPGSAGRSAD